MRWYTALHAQKGGRQCRQTPFSTARHAEHAADSSGHIRQPAVAFLRVSQRLLVYFHARDWRVPPCHNACLDESRRQSGMSIQRRSLLPLPSFLLFSSVADAQRRRRRTATERARSEPRRCRYCRVKQPSAPAPLMPLASVTAIERQRGRVFQMLFDGAAVTPESPRGCALRAIVTSPPATDTATPNMFLPQIARFALLTRRSQVILQPLLHNKSQRRSREGRSDTISVAVATATGDRR